MSIFINLKDTFVLKVISFSIFFLVFHSTSFAQSLTVTVLTNQDVSCHGGNNGELQAHIYGGMPPYSFQWSNNNQSLINSNLSSGIYTITVTDASGQQTNVKSTIHLTQPVQIYLETSSQAVSSIGAADGSAEVSSIVGGLAPYSYEWSPFGGFSVTANNLTEGSYQVLVTDALGCTVSKEVFVESPAQMQILVSNIEGPSCSNSNDGSISVMAINGVEPYYYWWSPMGGQQATANNLSSGVYTVYAMDSRGTYKSATISLLPSSTFSASLQAVTMACHGMNTGSVAVNNTGGTPPFTYNWSPNIGSTSTITGIPSGIYQCVVTDARGCVANAGSVVVQQSFLQFSLDAVALSNTTCTDLDGGSARAQVSGGHGPYSYLWEPSSQTTQIANKLTQGNYTVVVTDAYGCSLSDSIHISGPSVLMSIDTIISNSVTCFDSSNGSLNIKIKNGTAPFTYVVNNGPNVSSTVDLHNLQVGSYDIMVTDSEGCTASANAEIKYSQYLQEEISTQDKQEFCHGESATLNLTRIQGNSYEWMKYFKYTGDTGSDLKINRSGNYAVEVTTPEGCIFKTNRIKLTKLSKLVASIQETGPIDFCANEKVELNANADPGYTYLWYKYGKIISGETNSKLITKRPGRYRVIIQNTYGCSSASKPIQLNLKPKFKVELTALGPTDLCDGDSVILQSSITGGVAPFSYRWYDRNNELIDETSDQLITESNGFYKVFVTDSNECTFANRGRITVYNISCRTMDETIEPINEIETDNNLDITAYPNPFRESINVVIPSFSEDQIELRISDLYGRRIYENSFPGAYEYEISVKGVDNGYYILEVIQGSRSGRVKILKQ